MGLETDKLFIKPKRRAIIDPVCASAEGFFLDYLRTCREWNYSPHPQRVTIRDWGGNTDSSEAIQKLEIPDCDIGFGRPTFLLLSEPYSGLLGVSTHSWTYDLLKNYYELPARTLLQIFKEMFALKGKVVTVRAIRNLEIGIADYASLPEQTTGSIKFPEAMVQSLSSIGIDVNLDTIRQNASLFHQFAGRNSIKIKR